MAFTIIHGAVSPETAYSRDGYPYGSLRTVCRWWIEKAIKGAAKGQYRVNQQTQNPKKGQVWNKPHASTYADFMVLYLDDKGQCHALHVSTNGTRGLSMFVASGLYAQLNEGEMEQFNEALHAGKRPYNRSEWERFAYLVGVVRATPDLPDGITETIYQAAREARPEDKYLHESDVKEVVLMVRKERETGKITAF
jgi:hypothetical protein